MREKEREREAEKEREREAEKERERQRKREGKRERERVREKERKKEKERERQRETERERETESLVKHCEVARCSRTVLGRTVEWSPSPWNPRVSRLLSLPAMDDKAEQRQKSAAFHTAPLCLCAGFSHCVGTRCESMGGCSAVPAVGTPSLQWEQCSTVPTVGTVQRHPCSRNRAVPSLQ